MNFFSLFHLYGLIIGVGIVVALFLIERKAKQHEIFEVIESLTIPTLFCGIVGARIWHVITDFGLYQNSLHKIFFIWEGGLSILGGLVGGITAIYFYSQKNKTIFYRVLDVCIFGVPIAQSVGRIGNYVNQELYGLPTTLPWKIFIDQGYRLPKYTHVSHYHPLFLYELLLVGSFGLWIWMFDKKNTNLVGTGWYFYLYVFYYSLIRFLLEFLRIDKSVIMNSSIGINQLILVGIGVYSYIKLKTLYGKTKKK